MVFKKMFLIGVLVSVSGTGLYAACDKVVNTTDPAAPVYKNGVKEKDDNKIDHYKDLNLSGKPEGESGKVVIHTKDSLDTVVKYYEKVLGKKLKKSGDNYYLVLEEYSSQCGEHTASFVAGIRIYSGNFYLLSDQIENGGYLTEADLIHRKYKKQEKGGEDKLEKKIEELQARAMKGDREAAKELAHIGQTYSSERSAESKAEQEEIEKVTYKVKIIIDYKSKIEKGKDKPGKEIKKSINTIKKIF